MNAIFPPASEEADLIVSWRPVDDESRFANTVMGCIRPEATR